MTQSLNVHLGIPQTHGSRTFAAPSPWTKGNRGQRSRGRERLNFRIPLAAGTAHASGWLMQRFLYLIVRALVGVLQGLPLGLVGRLGRWGGGLAYWLDARHRRMALRNLTACFGSERSPAAVRALARENFRRIGETFACSLKICSLTPAQVRQVLTLVGFERFRSPACHAERGRVVVTGHFGNFELYPYAGQFLPEFQFAATYRAVAPEWLNAYLLRLRQHSGCWYFERRTGGRALREAMNQQRLMLGLLADQHAGDKGLRLPFLGRDCATSAAPAVFALRYRCPLFPAICYRVGLGRWRIEVGEEIPILEAGQPRSVAAITQDINRALEAAVRRDPANWFWVHNRWKPAKRPRPPADSPVGSPPVAAPAA